MKIPQILKQAEKGDLECCSKCFWSPKQNPSIAFGKSCVEHGFDWKSQNRANSMYIVQDPGDTTPQNTGRLCAVHNSKNSSDKSAQQSVKLWSATVSLDYDNPEKDGYMRDNYWTNAILHGAGKSSNTENLRNKNIIEYVAKSCSNVLKLQILALQPKVIIANGKVAVNSLYNIGLLRKNWDILRYSFNKGAYQETVSKWNDMPEFTVFCTYHPAARVVNQTLSKLYKPETEEYLKTKIDKLEPTKSVNDFLQEYNNTENATSKGMRYLLNHWLDIGEKIRKGHNKSFQPIAHTSGNFKQINGHIQKMHTRLESGIAQYQLPIGDNMQNMNGLIGQKISLEFNGQIHCSNCGKRTNKSYSQGFCYPCCQQLARCDLCIMRPETCHYHLGTCREPEWGLKHCFAPHIVYLANSSGAKVGITRKTNMPNRWIDQGAVQALPIFEVESRLKSGQIEVALKAFVSDKTNWRKMLKNEVEVLDLPAIRDQILGKIDITGATVLNEKTTQIRYPVNQYPSKINALNFDKTPKISGVLQGIKGQYLILEQGVLNIRKFGAYNITLTY